jgi:hypothetical protein
MKKSQFLSLLLALAFPLISAAKDGISYKMLWHTYKLSNLSTDPFDAMRITSKIGISPNDIKFSPRTASGVPLMQCEDSGRCILEWDEKFYQIDASITHDQTKGSLNLEANWTFEKPGDVPWLLFIAFNLDRLTESWYHYSILQTL